MLKQIPANPVPRMVMACAFTAMLLIDIFALRVSSIALLLIAAAASLVLFTISQNTGRGNSR
jgi:chromate transporter